MAAGAGPIGGASGDAGTEYGRAVGAFALACGLAGEPLVGFDPSGRDAQVSAVAYQTDDPVDDVRISFATGHTCFIQAKRNLGFGDQFKDAVAQWVKAAQAGLGDHDHVAIAAPRARRGGVSAPEGERPRRLARPARRPRPPAR